MASSWKEGVTQPKNEVVGVKESVREVQVREGVGLENTEWKLKKELFSINE
jgi:hypothetical protein